MPWGSFRSWPRKVSNRAQTRRSLRCRQTQSRKRGDMMEQADIHRQLFVRKVAFVAMPFGRRPVEMGTDTVQVDFDALYEKAIEPALSALNYLCIRADHQEGSVIVRDMLEQLVHADLVIADVTAQNGNVYYEAGVRHAASRTGCVL